MKLLFITMSRIADINAKGIYPDLMREFVKAGHEVYIAAPSERRFREKTHLISWEHCKILRIRVGNLQKTNLIEKGISTLLVESQFRAAIKKHFSDVKFDVVLYSTPPITFANVIQYVKKRDDAVSYLLLKDIFPQNAVDLGMFSKSSVLYRYFRAKEEKLYRISDYIGCMSQANVDFVLKHNSTINKEIVHISPNSIAVEDKTITDEKRVQIREKYQIPRDTTVFVYGGNLGKPQDIPFIIECLKANENKKDRYFVICGTGTEFSKLQAYFEESKPDNMLLLNGLPKEEYEEFVAAFDVGLIFLDHRFTIPNFPSRLLSYMQNGMPTLACTDTNTDVGKVIEDGKFGWWCESNDAGGFTELVNRIVTEDIKQKGENAKQYLREHYTAERTYRVIEKYVNQ